MKIRIDVYQGPLALGHIEYDWTDAKTWQDFWDIAEKQYPNLQRIELHINQQS